MFKALVIWTVSCVVMAASAVLYQHMGYSPVQSAVGMGMGYLAIGFVSSVAMWNVPEKQGHIDGKWLAVSTLTWPVWHIVSIRIMKAFGVR